MPASSAYSLPEARAPVGAAAGGHAWWEVQNPCAAQTRGDAKQDKEQGGQLVLHMTSLIVTLGLEVGIGIWDWWLAACGGACATH